MRKYVYKVVAKDRTSIYAPGKYSLTYNIGQIISAVPRTIGIMCFKTRSSAEDFMNASAVLGLIIRVRPIGRAKTPRRIPDPVIEYMDDFYTLENDHILGSNLPITFYVHEGTICYQQVEVID